LNKVEVKKKIKDYKRIKIFPKKFTKIKLGKLYSDKDLILESHFQYRTKHRTEDFNTLYAIDDKYDFLNIGDALGITDPEHKDRKNYIQITYKESVKASDYLLRNPHKENAVLEQIGRAIKPEENINVFEFIHTYDFKYDPKRN
jgi:hypothetical protein